PHALLALAPLESVDALAAGIGPGSFTGLRVGLAAVKALAYARKLPIQGASSLRALAVAARRPAELLVPTLEARRGELYACAVRGTDLVLPDTVLRARDLAPGPDEDQKRFTQSSQRPQRGMGSSPGSQAGARKRETNAFLCALSVLCVKPESSIGVSILDAYSVRWRCGE